MDVWYIHGRVITKSNVFKITPPYIVMQGCFSMAPFCKVNIFQLKLNAGFMGPCGGQQAKGESTCSITSLPVYREYQRRRIAYNSQQ